MVSFSNGLVVELAKETGWAKLGEIYGFFLCCKK